MMNAARVLTAGAVDAGARPAVVSAIVKCYLTEAMRAVVNDAMDIRAGSAICRGPRNDLARAYLAAPIGITVEGANIQWSYKRTARISSSITPRFGMGSTSATLVPCEDATVCMLRARGFPPRCGKMGVTSRRITHFFATTSSYDLCIAERAWTSLSTDLR